jgi:hypothetical protein
MWLGLEQLWLEIDLAHRGRDELRRRALVAGRIRRVDAQQRLAQSLRVVGQARQRLHAPTLAEKIERPDDCSPGRRRVTRKLAAEKSNAPTIARRGAD